MELQTAQLPNKAGPDYANSPIARLTKSCLEKFLHLQEAIKARPGFSVQEDSPTDSVGRFRIWVGSIGAQHPVTDTRAADYRLREGPEIVERLLEILEELGTTLDDALEVVVNNRSETDPEPNFEDGDGDAGEPWDPQSELQELLSSIPDLITSLLKVSILIRKATGRDRYARAASSDEEPFLSWFDTRHVIDRFPKLAKQQWLAKRLGEANTQRRQFLRYCKAHHHKLSREPKIAQKPTVPNLQPVEHQPDRQTVHTASTRPTWAVTKASTFEAEKLAPTALETVDLDDNDDAVSQTVSFVSSRAQGDGESILRVIPLSDASKDNFDSPFLCPYCYGIVQARRERSWRKHVFCDIRPYVCTFPECHSGLFEDRSAWFRHEVEFHRRQWTCQSCANETKTFATPELLEEHTAVHFKEKLHSAAMKAVLNASSTPVSAVSAASACPFCDEWFEKLKADAQRRHISSDQLLVVSLGDLERHLAGHMEQLALFAIVPDSERNEIPDSEHGSHPDDFNKEQYRIEMEDWQQNVEEMSDSPEGEEIISEGDEPTSKPSFKYHPDVQKRVERKVLSDLEFLSLETTIQIATTTQDKARNLSNLLWSLRTDNRRISALETLATNMTRKTIPRIIEAWQEMTGNDHSIMELTRALTTLLLHCSKIMANADQEIRQAGSNTIWTEMMTLESLSACNDTLLAILAVVSTTSADNDPSKQELIEKRKRELDSLIKRASGTIRLANQESQEVPSMSGHISRIRDAQARLAQARQYDTESSFSETKEPDNENSDDAFPGLEAVFDVPEDVEGNQHDATTETTLIFNAAVGDVKSIVAALNSGTNVNNVLDTGSLTSYCDHCDNFVNFAWTCKTCVTFDVCNDCKQNGVTCERANEGHTLSRSTEFNSRSTILSVAAEEGHGGLVETLLKLGADPDSGGGLHATVHNQRLKISRLLIEAGANVDGLGRTFERPLVAAANRGNKLLARLLLMHGASVTSENTPDYLSPLIAAVKNLHYDVTELLLEHGADPKKEFGSYGNALDVAEASRAASLASPSFNTEWDRILTLLKLHIDKGSGTESHPDSKSKDLDQAGDVDNLEFGTITTSDKEQPRTAAISQLQDDGTRLETLMASTTPTVEKLSMNLIPPSPPRFSLWNESGDGNAPEAKLSIGSTDESLRLLSVQLAENALDLENFLKTVDAIPETLRQTVSDLERLSVILPLLEEHSIEEYHSTFLLQICIQRCHELATRIVGIVQNVTMKKKGSASHQNANLSLLGLDWELDQAVTSMRLIIEEYLRREQRQRALQDRDIPSEILDQVRKILRDMSVLNLDRIKNAPTIETGNDTEEDIVTHQSLDREIKTNILKLDRPGISAFQTESLPEVAVEPDTTVPSFPARKDIMTVARRATRYGIQTCQTLLEWLQKENRLAFDISNTLYLQTNLLKRIFTQAKNLVDTDLGADAYTTSTIFPVAEDLVIRDVYSQLYMLAEKIEDIKAIWPNETAEVELGEFVNDIIDELEPTRRLMNGQDEVPDAEFDPEIFQSPKPERNTQQRPLVAESDSSSVTSALERSFSGPVPEPSRRSSYSSRTGRKLAIADTTDRSRFEPIGSPRTRKSVDVNDASILDDQSGAGSTLSGFQRTGFDQATVGKPLSVSDDRRPTVKEKTRNSAPRESLATNDDENSDADSIVTNEPRNFSRTSGRNSIFDDKAPTNKGTARAPSQREGLGQSQEDIKRPTSSSVWTRLFGGIGSSSRRHT